MALFAYVDRAASSLDVWSSFEQTMALRQHRYTLQRMPLGAEEA